LEEVLTASAAAGWAWLLSGKRGVVLELGGAPVIGGAEGLGGREANPGGFEGSLGMPPEGGRERVGMGLVTAVDHAGFIVGVAIPWELAEGLMGRVVAAEIFGRGVILVEAGLRGRGGRLIRKVSRLGAFESEPSGRGGTAESAIIGAFYSYFRKYSMAKFVIVTFLSLTCFNQKMKPSLPSLMKVGKFTEKIVILRETMRKVMPPADGIPQAAEK
jgi:hypothetical protein